MPLTHTFETGRRKQRFLGVEREVVSTITYRLSPRPYRLHSRLDLPKSYELEDHETDEDTWIKRNGMFYNLKDFCRIGCRHIPGPMGGAQCAAGDFMIAAYNGEIYAVSTTEVN